MAFWWNDEETLNQSQTTLYDPISWKFDSYRWTSKFKAIGQIFPYFSTNQKCSCLPPIIPTPRLLIAVEYRLGYETWN